MPIVGDSQHAINLARQDQIYPSGAGIPGVCDQLGQRDLRHMGHLPELPQKVIILEQ